MTVQIFTSVVNRPDFLELQSKLFSKFLKSEYQFHVVYDAGIDEKILKEFRGICEKDNLILHKADDWVIDASPSTCISKVVQWIYEEIMIKQYHDSICMIIDSDMFLINDLDINAYILSYPILGIPQNRGHVNYITNQIMVFNMPKILQIDKNIKFMDGNVDGQIVDSCGEMYYWFNRNNIDLKKVITEYPTHYNEIEIQKEEITNGINFELFDGIFLHYRAGSNWFSEWKQIEDPLVKKKKIFNKIIDSILNE